MILETDFTVPATPDRVWNALLDLDALGACLPGASLSRVDGDSTLQGAVRPQVNGSELPCIGTLRAVDADEDGRSASAALHMHQVGGPGFATALLRGKVAEADGGSRVAVSVDGRVAAPGVSEDASRPEAERLLGELAASLESSLASARPRRSRRPRRLPPHPPPRPTARRSPRPPRRPPSAAGRRSTRPPHSAPWALAGAVALAAALLRGKRARAGARGSRSGTGGNGRRRRARRRALAVAQGGPSAPHRRKLLRRRLRAPGRAARGDPAQPACTRAHRRDRRLGRARGRARGRRRHERRPAAPTAAHPHAHVPDRRHGEAAPVAAGRGPRALLGRAGRGGAGRLALRGRGRARADRGRVRAARRPARRHRGARPRAARCCTPRRAPTSRARST